MIKKLIKLFHKHKFKSLPATNYSVRGIMCSRKSSVGYTETGQKVIKTCKCGLTVENKINVIVKYDRGE